MLYTSADLIVSDKGIYLKSSRAGLAPVAANPLPPRPEPRSMLVPPKAVAGEPRCKYLIPQKAGRGDLPEAAFAPSEVAVVKLFSDLGVLRALAVTLSPQLLTCPMQLTQRMVP